MVLQLFSCKFQSYLCKRSFPQCPISYFSDSSKFYKLCWSLQQFTIILELAEQAATEADTNMTFGKYLHNYPTSTCRQGMTGNYTDLNSFRFNKSLQREVKGFVAAHVVFEPFLRCKTKDFVIEKATKTHVLYDATMLLLMHSTCRLLHCTCLSYYQKQPNVSNDVSNTWQILPVLSIDSHFHVDMQIREHCRQSDEPPPQFQGVGPMSLWGVTKRGTVIARLLLTRKVAVIAVFTQIHVHLYLSPSLFTAHNAHQLSSIVINSLCSHVSRNCAAQVQRCRLEAWPLGWPSHRIQGAWTCCALAALHVAHPVVPLRCLQPVLYRTPQSLAMEHAAPFAEAATTMSAMSKEPKPVAQRTVMSVPLAIRVALMMSDDVNLFQWLWWQFSLEFAKIALQL